MNRGLYLRASSFHSNIRLDPVYSWCLSPVIYSVFYLFSQRKKQHHQQVFVPATVLVCVCLFFDYICQRICFCWSVFFFQSVLVVRSVGRSTNSRHLPGSCFHSLLIRNKLVLIFFFFTHSLSIFMRFYIRIIFQVHLKTPP